MEQRIWRCSVGPARAGLPKLLDSVLHGWLGARGAPTSAGRSWAGTQCNQFKESAIKSSGAGRGGAGGRCGKVCWSRVCKSQTRKMIVCGFLKALARRHRKYFIFDLHCVCVCVVAVCFRGGQRGGQLDAMACAVIRQPASPHWQAWGLGGSNLGRSFGERRIASFHRGGWGVLAECSIGGRHHAHGSSSRPATCWAATWFGLRKGSGLS